MVAMTIDSKELMLLTLFLIVSAVALIAKRVNLPYTIVLVAVGLVLGVSPFFHPPVINQELLYAIFLPGLIYESAIHIDVEDFFRDIWITLFLVIPGVVFSTFISAYVLMAFSTHLASLNYIDWSIALLFGAAVAATDPVSVVAIFKKLGIPKRLRYMIESESLLNDGTSIVIFLILLSYVSTHHYYWDQVIKSFVVIGGGGLFIGALIGFFVSYALRNIDDAMIAIAITAIAAYGSFLIADRLGLSGVMSTVATGLISGYRGLYSSAFPSILVTTESFWEFVSFALNSFIFLLMGFTIKIDLLYSLWPAIIVAYISVLIARAILIIIGWGIFYPTKIRFPFSWAVVIWWGGLRGALSMVLALSIPDNYAFKDIIVAMVFGVVLLSIFIQGLSMAPILRFLGLAKDSSKLEMYETLKTKIALTQIALDHIDSMLRQHVIDSQTANELKQNYLDDLEKLRKELNELQLERQDLLELEKKHYLRRALNEQKAKLLQLFHQGVISNRVYRQLLNEIDAKILEFETLDS